MNAFRMRFGGADDKAIVVRSTVDQTWRLAPKTDEQIQLGKDDLINIKNISERKILVRMKATKVENEALMVRSTRRGAFRMTEIDHDTFWMQPGEVLNIRTTQAVDNKSGYSAGVVA